MSDPAKQTHAIAPFAPVQRSAYANLTPASMPDEDAAALRAVERLHAKRAASEAPAEIEPWQDIAARLYPLGGDGIIGSGAGVKIRDEQIAAWCIAKAEAAEREAAEHDRTADALREQQNGVAARSHRERAMRCEGQAVAWRGTAALLRGLGK